MVAGIDLGERGAVDVEPPWRQAPVDGDISLVPVPGRSGTMLVAGFTEGPRWMGSGDRLIVTGLS